MAKLECSRGNCGMGELYGLADSNLLVQNFKSYGLVLFSDNIKFRKGEKLADIIKANKLGTLVESPVVRNPAMGSTEIKAWIWAPDHVAVERYQQGLGLVPLSSQVL